MDVCVCLMGFYGYKIGCQHLQHLVNIYIKKKTLLMFKG